ncbi:hypothetical protein [Sphingomonas insulae]|uniref:hypothetical protein n=1 Tax=Sphingomonas insulae TaxID=424800 RepID=UPI0013D00011|nr:hypothetical protein [Sphingomonas insulae]
MSAPSLDQCTAVAGVTIGLEFGIDDAPGIKAAPVSRGLHKPATLRRALSYPGMMGDCRYFHYGSDVAVPLAVAAIDRARSIEKTGNRHAA